MEKEQNELEKSTHIQAHKRAKQNWETTISNQKSKHFKLSQKRHMEKSVHVCCGGDDGGEQSKREGEAEKN